LGKNTIASVDLYYLKNNPAKCHPYSISNDGALGFFCNEVRRPNMNNNKKKMSSEKGSLPNPKTHIPDKHPVKG